MASHGIGSKGLSFFFFMMQVHAFNIIVPQYSIHAGTGMSVLLLTDYSTVGNITITWTHFIKPVANYSGNDVFYAPDYQGRAELFPANGTLRLDNLSLSDTGSYIVEVKQNTIESNKQTLNLTVHESVKKPIVYFSPNVPHEYKECIMECNTTSPGIIKYTWRKDGKDFKPTDKFSFKENNRVINNLKAETSDIGNYTCTAADQFTETESDPNNFNIIYGPNNLTVKINGQPASGEKAVYFGDHVMLEGQADAYPTAVYRWEKDETSLKEGVLAFTASLNHGGLYRCTATNYNNSKNDVTTLALKVLTKLPEGDPTCTSSSNNQSLVSLTCKWPNGKPPGNLSWTDSMGTQLSKKDSVDELTVQVNVTTSEEQKPYNCQATHYQINFPTFCVIQLKSPEVHMEDITVKAGSSGILKCIVTAEPKAAITWIGYRGEEITGNTEDHEIHNDSLLIKRVGDNETVRTYICLASNIFGTRMVAATVIIDRVNMTIAEIALTVLSSVLLVTIIGLVIFVATKKISCITETSSKTQEDVPRKKSSPSVYMDLDQYNNSPYEGIQTRNDKICERAKRPLPRVPSKM